jgi:hypothetical protein
MAEIKAINVDASNIEVFDISKFPDQVTVNCRGTLVTFAKERIHRIGYLQLHWMSGYNPGVFIDVSSNKFHDILDLLRDEPCVLMPEVLDEHGYNGTHSKRIFDYLGIDTLEINAEIQRRKDEAKRKEEIQQEKRKKRKIMIDMINGQNISTWADMSEFLGPSWADMLDDEDP